MNIELYNENVFESIKHIGEVGNEYWLARELQKALEYTEWRKFEQAIKRVKETCNNSNNKVYEHFVGADKKINLGKTAERKVLDYRLSRYACYLIVQNGDSRKNVIALGQTYFAVQTRRQELAELEYSLLSEDEKRFYKRNKTRIANYLLNQTAKNAGVKNFDKFHNAGYRVLYNG